MINGHSWHIDFKHWVEAYTGLDQDALHVHGAIFLYMLAVFALRRRSFFLPWLLVLVLEIGNEALDLREQYKAGWVLTWGEAAAAGWPEALKDIWNTMIWPSVFLILSPWLRRVPAPEPAALDEPAA